MGSKKDADIYPSVMCCKPWDLEAYVHAFEETGVAGIHFDVMDGHYVPNIMLGSEDFKAIRQLTDLSIDVHIMATEPERFVPVLRPPQGRLAELPSRGLPPAVSPTRGPSCHGRVLQALP
jgi:pentose-5-phosphate-3-epimerase